MSDVEVYEDPRNEVIVPDENLVETTEESTTNVIEETTINIIVQDDSNNVEVTEEVTNLIAEEQRLIIEPEVEVIKILRAETPGPAGPEGPPGPPGADAPAGANTALSNLITTAINASLFPSLDSAISLGSSTKYWANLYADRVYFNSTAYLDGATAGTILGVAKISINSGTTLTTATQNTYALQVSNGSGALAIGSDASATYIQSFGSRPLRINSAGNNTEITAGNLGVGFAAPVHKLQVAGTIAPDADSTRSIGTSSLFWSNLYTDNIYFGNTDLQISGSGSTITLGKYTDATAATVGEAPSPASVLGMNNTAYAYGIGAFSGMYDYLYCADRNPSITATSNYGTVANLFDGDLANTLNIPVASLGATPWVLTVTNNTGDWGFSDVLKLLFTGHRLYSTSGTFTDWTLETMDAGGIWYTEVSRTGVSDAVNLLAPNLHRTNQSPVYTDGASWHKIKAIRLTVSGGTASAHSPLNITISGMQLRNTRPSFSAADGIGALDVRGGSVYGSIGLYTPSPTHTITLANTTSGITHYNTPGQTTTFERIRQYWTGNQFRIETGAGGTGVVRDIVLSAGSTLTIGSSGSYGVRVERNATSLDILLVNSTGMTHSSAVQAALKITPTINQSGTGGYAGILLNVTESATGSGNKSLMDLQIGSSSKFRVTNTGKIVSALAQTYTESNVTTSRSYDADVTTIDGLADIIGTLIADLRTVGIIN